MPANKRHLGRRGQRISKTLAGVVGGYFAAVAIHLAVGAIWESSASWIQTMTYSAFSLWIAAIVVALLFKKAWKVWSLYLLVAASCSGLIYLLR